MIRRAHGVAAGTVFSLLVAPALRAGQGHSRARASRPNRQFFNEAVVHVCCPVSGPVPFCLRYTSGLAPIQVEATQNVKRHVLGRPLKTDRFRREPYPFSETCCACVVLEDRERCAGDDDCRKAWGWRSQPMPSTEHVKKDESQRSWAQRRREEHGGPGSSKDREVPILQETCFEEAKMRGGLRRLSAC